MPAMANRGGAPADPLADYAAGPAGGDLYTAAPDAVQAQWRGLAAGLAEQGDGGFSGLHDQIDRQIQDLGMAYRFGGEQEERAWPLSPFPLLIGTQEWTAIEEGLIQRARLLEHIVADIYGPQTLVQDGHLPAAVVSGSPNFSRKMLGAPPPGGRHIHLYAVDLARGPTGEWRVLADRLRLPTGIGYALENRLALSRVTGALLTRIHSRRLADFFSRLRLGLAANCSRDEPRMALLTPGRLNQSYPEQAHLARYLGLLLVEGRDLVVSDRKLYVRTIEGLKRIDALWRWVDTRMLDPLAFDSNSAIGVPDLFEAWSAGDLVVANWPGAGVLESRAFSAFLPRLARTVLGEPLSLPNVATWWCGQAGEHAHVRAHFDELVISSAFGERVEGLPEGRSRAVASLSTPERERLLEALERRPMDYTGQEIVRLSTTPTLVGGRIAPRPFTMRAFVCRDGDGNWAVMPGGFARLSAQGDLRTSLMGEGDMSADVCIVDEVAILQQSLLTTNQVPAIRRTTGILPSQAADNLYWFSRYSERAEMTVRIVRTLLGSSIEADGGGARTSESLKTLIAVLHTWGAISAKTRDASVREVCGQALGDAEQNGSAAALIASGREIGRGLRDRMAVDFWRIANAPAALVGHAHVEAMLETCNQLIDRLSALSGLAAENMGRSPAWRFYDLGRRLERAVNACRIARKLGGDDADHDALSVLLDLNDSQIIYRTRYLTGPVRAPVLDLTLLDPQNPRSLHFQLTRIEDHLRRLPSLSKAGLVEPQLRAAKSLLSMVETLDADDIDDAWMQDVETHLLALSDTLSQRYFLQYEKAEKTVMDPFLA